MNGTKWIYLASVSWCCYRLLFSDPSFFIFNVTEQLLHLKRIQETLFANVHRPLECSVTLSQGNLVNWVYFRYSRNLNTLLYRKVNFMAVQFFVDVALALGCLLHMEIGSSTNVLEIRDTSLFRVKTGSMHFWNIGNTVNINWNFTVLQQFRSRYPKQNKILSLKLSAYFSTLHLIQHRL